METSIQQIEASVNHLIDIANDGKYGYENAAKDVEDVTLKELFTQYSSERASFVHDLINEATKLGMTPSKGGNTEGALHRTWMDIKSTITSGERASILKTCITGEEAAVKAYEDEISRLGENDLYDLVSEQLNSIRVALNNIRSLEQTVSSI